LEQSFQAHSDIITRIEYFTNNSYAATASWDSTVKIWNTTSNPWTLISIFFSETGSSLFTSIKFINTDTVASGDQNGVIQIFSINTGILILWYDGLSGVFSLQVFTNNEGVTCLAAGYGNGNINIFDANTYWFKTSLTGHTSSVYDLAMISDKNLLASSSGDATVRLWDLTTNTCKFELNGHGSSVLVLKVISSDILASGSWDQTIKLWDITSGQLIRTLTGHTSNIHLSLDLII
jgi:WD40 repeat protein